MSFKGKHIVTHDEIKRGSFVKSIIILCLAVLFSPLDSLLGQVISNNGAAISVTTGTVVNAKDATNISGAILSNSGTINLTGNYINTATTNGIGTFRIGGNWTNTGGIFSGNNTVVFNGSDNQSIIRAGGETFFNLSIDNSGAQASKTVGLSNLVTVTGTLLMKSGNVNATSNKLFLSNFAASSLDYTSLTGSRILGRFERGINEAGTYLFPLGTASHYNPANLITNSIPAPGTILSEFFTAPPPGNAGLPLPDPPVEVATAYPGGYWNLTANGFSSANFSINLDGSGFIDTIFDITRVLKRTAGGNWTLDGTHSDAVDSVVFRNNLTGNISPLGTQFAMGRPRPLITFHPRDTIVCETTYPVFKVLATGANPLFYTWYKVPGISLTGPGYSGVNTPTLTINNVDLADAGDYYCIIKDRYGNATFSLTATLTVNKIPVATASNSSQLEECSSVAFDNVVLGESYGVPGTTYIWSRTNPSGIITGIPLSGSGLNIGDILSGSFTNTTDAPITITFSITPVGPSPTYCTGVTILATIRVNPVPRVIPVNLNNFKPDSSICFGGTTDIKLTSPTQMTSGSILFDYTATPTGNPGVVTGVFTAGTNLPVNYEIKRPYGNLSDTIQSVFFAITPKVSNGVCAPGLNDTSQIRVHAKPARRIAILVPLTCEGGSDATLMAVTSKGAGPLGVFWQGPYGYTNNSLFTLTNRPGGNYRVTLTDNLGCTSFKDTVVQGAFIDSYLFAFPKPMNPNGTQYEITCPGYNNGDVQFAVNSGGTPTYEYWLMRNSIDTTTAIAHDRFNAVGLPISRAGLIEGKYTLIIKDANGCFNIRTTGPGIFEYTEAFITEPAPIAVEFDKKQYAGGFNVSCRNYSDGKAWVKSTTGGNGGNSYLWERPLGTNVGSSDTINGVSAGWYYLRSTDNKGCTKLDSVLITQPAGMDLASVQLKTSRDGNFNISCNGFSDGKITLNITGGSGTYQYNWNGPGGPVTTSVNNISGLRAGHYTAVVADLNGCTLSALDTVLTEPAILDVVPVPSIAPDAINNISCNGGIGNITLTVTGGSVGTYKYNWSILSGGSGLVPEQRDQNNLTAGNYRVVVSDSNLCSITKDIPLTQPQPLATVLVPTHITCQSAGYDNGSINLTVTGGAVPYSYSWTNGAFTAFTEDLSNLTPGTGYYKVTVTDLNGCQIIDSIKINLPPDLTYSSLPSNYNGFNISCFGMANGSISITPITGQQPYSYNWSTPDGSGLTPGAANQTGLTAGQYSVTITDANSCTATGTFTLTEPLKLDMTVSLPTSDFGGFNINCAGASTGSIDVNGVNNVGTVNYLWSDGATGKLRSNIPAGTYKVVLTDENFCSADSTIILTEPDSIKIEFAVTQAFCPDSPDGAIQLTVTGGVVITDYNYRWSDNSTSPNLSNILKGRYRVIVTDANNCTARDSVKMVPLNETCLIIPNAISPNEDNINDFWNIGMKELYPQMEVKVFNRWGELLWKSEKGYPRPWDGKSKGSTLPIDSYHYIIELHNGSKPLVGNITIVR